MNIACGKVRNQFSEYLDGALTGRAMQRVASHLDSCHACADDFAAWRRTQQMIASLGPAKAPADLALRLRVALSQEKARTPRQNLARWQMRWQNTVAPFLLQASAGLASAIVLIGTVILLVGAFAAPETLAARRDTPLGDATPPRFLYTSSNGDTAPLGDRDNPIVVEAYVDGAGRVYDYQIVTGPHDSETRSEIESLLLFSVFVPAKIFGQPVRGLAVLSFSGVSVQG